MCGAHGSIMDTRQHCSFYTHCNTIPHLTVDCNKPVGLAAGGTTGELRSAHVNSGSGRQLAGALNSNVNVDRAELTLLIDLQTAV